MGLAILELLIVASIIPYIEIIQGESDKVIKLFNIIDLTFSKQINNNIVLYFTGLIFLILIIKFMLEYMILLYNRVFSIKIYSHIILLFYDGYLNYKYEKIVDINSTVQIKTMLDVAINIIYKIQKSIAYVREFFLVTILIIAILIQDFTTSLFLIIIFFITGYSTHRALRAKQLKSGEIREQSGNMLWIWIDQSMSSIKEIRINLSEKYFRDKVKTHLNNFVWHDSTLNIYPKIPKLFIEFITLVLLIGIVAYFAIIKESVKEIVPLIIFYAFVIRRLLPGINEILAMRLEFIGSLAGITILNNELDAIKKYRKHIEYSGIEFNDSIVLKNVNFSYKKKKILTDINVTIKKHQSIAFVGKSGGGKTTLIEILSSLLQPNDGEIIIDNQKYKNTSGLRSIMGYVPQSTALIDGTILENIVFGETSINQKKIDEIISICQLEEFINQLEKGIHTHIGEKGMKISGGQRQRIGIARGLYKEPELIILDEATSSLDYTTEKNLIESINKYYGSKTILIVAHRLSTIVDVDIIYLLEKGKIIASGNHKYLIKNSQEYFDLYNKESNI